MVAPQRKLMIGILIKLIYRQFFVPRDNIINTTAATIKLNKNFVC